MSTEGRARAGGFGRAAKLAGAALAGLVALCILALAIFPKAAVGFGLRTWFAAQGVEPAHFVVEEAGWRRVALGQIMLGDKGLGMTAQGLTVAFGPRGPFGAVRSVAAANLNVEGRFDENGLSFGAIDPLLKGGGGEGGLPSFPIILSTAQLRVSSSAGAFTARSEGGTIAQGAKPIDVQLLLEPDPKAAYPLARHEGRLSVTFPGADAIHANLALTPSADIAPNAAAIGDLAGEGEWNTGGALQLRLKAEKVSAPQFHLTIGALEANLTQDEKGLNADASLLRVAQTTSAETKPLRVEHALLSLKDWSFEDKSRGKISLTADVDGALWSGLGFEKGLAALTGALERSGDTIALILDDCARIEGLSFQTWHVPLVSLCAEKKDEPILTWTQNTDAPSAVTLKATVPSAPLTEKAAARAKPNSGTLPALALDAAIGEKKDAFRLAVKAEGGRIPFSGSEVAVVNLTLAMSAAGTGDEIRAGNIALDRVDVTDLRSSPRFSPITLKGTAGIEAEDVAFKVNAHSGERALAHLDGRHGLKAGGGSAKLSFESLAFAKGGLQPAAFLPLLSGAVSDVSGTIEGGGDLRWDEKTIDSTAVIALKDLAFRTSIARLEGVSGTIALAGLLPIFTSKPQEIRVRMMDVGVPLTDGRLRFSLARDGSFSIEEAAFPFLDGKVSVLPTRFGADTKVPKLVLAVDRIDLALLLKLIDVDGLSGTGRVSGRVPVLLEASRQVLEAGHMEAEAPGGILSYKSSNAAAATSAETKLLFQALDDFHYKGLSVDLEGPLNGELSLKVQLKGNNPKLYSGYPIELNVATGGPFVAMLRQGLYSYQNTYQNEGRP